MIKLGSIDKDGFEAIKQQFLSETYKTMSLIDESETDTEEDTNDSTDGSPIVLSEASSDDEWTFNLYDQICWLYMIYLNPT